MRLTARLSLLALGIAVAAGMVWWLQRNDLPPWLPPEAEAPTPADGDDAPTALPDRPAHDTETPVVLPPRDTPLDRLWSALQAPAQAGDSGAACRLAIETVRCMNAGRIASTWASPRDRGTGELATLLAFEGDPTAFRRSSDVNEAPVPTPAVPQTTTAGTPAPRCAGLSPARVDQALALLRTAALAGQPDAQAAYAAGEGWFLTLPGGMRRPEFDQWRLEAPMVVARMLDEGHPEAPGLLAGAYSGQTWLGGLYEADPERAATFLILNLRLVGLPQRADGFLRDLEPASRARARQQAEALYARHYAGRSTPRAGLYLGAGVWILQPDRFDSEAKPALCTPRPAAPPSVDTPMAGS